MRRHRNLKLTICLAALVAGASLTLSVPSATAQAQARRTVDVEAQSLMTALREVAAVMGVSIAYDAELVKDRQAPAIRGSFTAEEAFTRLIANERLRVRRTPDGSFVLEGPSAGRAAEAASEAGAAGAVTLPEILVQGNLNWTLNTGIRRSENDSQPFVVVTREEIERSGSASLEFFLRDYLTTNATVSSSDQAGTNYQGRSVINLRGLGSRETLILVDGRRQPGVDTGNGDINQSSIRNIPLAAIERIEVLSSSASGIYGQGATGGVINIILRRDYNGAELTTTYADTYDFAAPDTRVDFTYGRNIEGGRTNLSFTASWREADPLLLGDRFDLQRDGLARALANDPNFEVRPPIGTTPNIRSSNRAPLRLDPAFGGTVLGSSFLFVPQGFRGVGLDGIAPLLANVGQYNTEAPDLASRGGLRAPLLFGSKQRSVTGAVRREMTSWLKMYLEGSVSDSESVNIQSFGINDLRLAANAPNNPFQQAIIVALPNYDENLTQASTSTSTQYRAVAGAIITLPYEWQAATDFSFSRSEFDTPRFSRKIDPFSEVALTNGTFDVLRDVRQIPLPITFVDTTFPDTARPSDVTTASLKLAGPLPLRLPAGQPRLALNFERTHDDFPESYVFTSDLASSRVLYTPAREQTIDSLYLEMLIPLVSPENNIPFIEELELQIAARYERYEGIGSGINYECYESFAPFPAGDVGTDLCDPNLIDFDAVALEDSHIDPTVSLKWRPTPDIAIRATYATGYLTPRLGALIRQPDQLIIQARDPERGGEPIGNLIPATDIGILPGFTGGNPDVRPETSVTQTAGFILTPRFLPGFRFSADWTLIEKEDNIFAPNGLLVASLSAAGQQGFETFLGDYPDRFVRGPASDGFALGPITSIDASLINFAGSRSESIDFSVEYAREFLGGEIVVDAAATHVLENTIQPFPGLPVEDYTGVILGSFSGSAFGTGSLDWKGNASMRWSNDRISIGTRVRYSDRYDLTLDGSAPLAQGAASVASQTYWDVFGTYQIRDDVEVRAGVNNLFNKKPPFDASDIAFYSQFGDPRLSNFYLTVRKSF